MSKKNLLTNNDTGSKKENTIIKSIKEGYNLPDSYFEVEVKKAKNKQDITTVLDLEQLTGTRLKEFYVETDETRGSNTISSLEQLLKNPLKHSEKLLFTGFTGSGKTTELIRLFYHLQDEFNVIIFSAWNRLKIDAITIEAILFEIVEDVLHYLTSHNLWKEDDEKLKDIIENITDWCSQTEIIKEEDKDESRSMGAGIDLLKGLFFSAKLESKFSSSERSTTSRIEERKITDLVFECNRIFDYLQEKTGKRSIVIIDDLEKMSFTKARQFFVENSSFIREFRCKMLLTIPVELVYHPDFAIIENVFGEAEVLPMIKVKNKEGNPYQQGIDTLTEILEKRIALSLFEDECYKQAITYSGGAIRELFKIIQKAALIEKSGKITTNSMQRSITQFKNIFAARVQEHGETKFDDYLDVLFDIYNGSKTTPQKNIALLDLLRTRAVMKYNEEGFYDTHPLLETFIKDYWEKRQKDEEKEK